ncbi:MAG: hypothetical protein L3J57_14435 [Desulfuromusa sp.]|nr:hypothetical protein [Desulfuromusa sp.]
MGIALLIVCLGYLILAAIIFFITKKLVKSKKIVVLVALVLILYPFRRVIFYQTLFYFYDRTPLQEIYQTVESPESVYWEDNVWPGFDAYGRHWMVKNYLDGVYLKVLALNGDDGKIYLYRATAKDFVKSNKMRPAVQEAKELHDQAFADAGNRLTKEVAAYRRLYLDILTEFRNLRKKETVPIFKQPEIYSSSQKLPPLNYRVEFNLLPKSLVINNDFDMLHADRISIIDAKSNQEIAYSQRYMAHAGFMSKFSGEQPKFDFKLGDIQPYKFDDRVLFEYTGLKGSFESVRAGLRRSSYNLSRLAWERQFKKQGGINNAN